MTRELAVVRSGISVMVVGRNDHQGHLFHSGDVHPLVKCAGLHPAFADACQNDKVFFSLKSFRHQRAHSDRNHCAEMTDHGELIVARSAPMDVTIAPAHWAETRAEISARDV